MTGSYAVVATNCSTIVTGYKNSSMIIDADERNCKERRQPALFKQKPPYRTKDGVIREERRILPDRRAMMAQPGNPGKKIKFGGML
jgi:hypothetical protein